MKLKIKIKNYEFELVKVNKVQTLRYFSNSIEVNRYLETHNKDSYVLSDDHCMAFEHCYIIIDLEDGFVLNKIPYNYTNCLGLIRQYM